MNGWGFAGVVLIWLSSTVFVARLFGLKVKGKPPSYLGLIGLFVLGFVLASANDALPDPKKGGDAETFFFLWLGFIAFVVLVSRATEWYRRFKAIRRKQASQAEIDRQVAALPPEVTGLTFDVLMLYGRKGRKPEQRQVTIHTAQIGQTAAGRPTVAAISGYCHLRHGPRTFNTSAIVELADATTGEVAVDPGEWLLDRVMRR